MPHPLAARIMLFTVLALGALTVYLHQDQFDVLALALWVEQHPTTAPLLFVLAYVLLTILFFPSTLMSLTGGILFGPLTGILYNQIGATLSAGLSFIIARYLAADWLENRLAGELRELKHGVERKGWRFVLLLRAVPGLPFALFNYALGLTRIRLMHFLAVTALCILPRVIFLSYAGHTGRRAIAGREVGIEHLLILLVLGSLIISPYLLRQIRKAGRLQIDRHGE